MKLKRGLSRLNAGHLGRSPAAVQKESLRLNEQNHRNGLPGVVHPTKEGPLRLIESYFSSAEPYGNREVGELLDFESEIYAALAIDESFSSVDFSQALFLDTETTGLAGGTGTLPFLTGLARFEDDQFIVEQLFVENYGLERPSLEYLRERLVQASCVITFNGKSFDWPLLRARYIMNRMTPPKPPPHYDLLHIARRVLKRRLNSVRLVSLEKHLLGQFRQGDVDGSEIPCLYFEYLETGQPGQLLDVIRHNELDLLAMPAIMGWLAEQYTHVARNGDPFDWVGLGLVAERFGDDERAEAFFDAAAQKTGFQSASAEAHLSLARRCHSQSRFEEEINHLNVVVGLDAGHWCDQAHHRLAITYEHKLRQYDHAIYHAGFCSAVEGYAAANHRLKRLKRKVAHALPNRQEQGGLQP